MILDQIKITCIPMVNGFPVQSDISFASVTISRLLTIDAAQMLFNAAICSVPTSKYKLPHHTDVLIEVNGVPFHAMKRGEFLDIRDVIRFAEQSTN